MAMWKVEYEDQIYALRVFRPGKHEDCEHEWRVMAAARAAGLPVPEVNAAGVWQDHPALLITWLAGRTVEDELRARLAAVADGDRIWSQACGDPCL
jgi:aminoglycoside phosphotransferase (APT) family kinase protein